MAAIQELWNCRAGTKGNSTRTSKDRPVKHLVHSITSPFHLYSHSSNKLHFTSAPNIWAFIAQLVEHCSANAEAIGSNPTEAVKIFSG